MKLQIGVAAAALFLLGALYGRQASLPWEQACRFEKIVNGTITAVHKIEPQRVQYVLEVEYQCRLLLFLPRFPVYGVGDAITLSGTVEQVEDFPPELAGYGKYLRRQGIAGTMRYPTTLSSQGAERRGTGPTLRQALRDKVEEIFPEPEASAVLAMVLGQVGSLPEQTTQDFRRTGVTHILAISGMNLSLLAGVVLGLSFSLPLPRIGRAFLVAAFMWAYVWLIVFPVSAVRAAWFWTFALAALQLRVLMGLPAIFLAAVTVMVSAHPLVLADIGFQLSISAVAGMWLAAFVSRQRKPVLIPKWLWVGLVATVGATLTTWPIVAYHFGMISLISVFANVLIVPAVAPFMVLALLALAVSFSVPLLALIFSFGVHLLWQWMTRVARILADFPAAAITDITMPLWFLAVYYLAGILLLVLLLAHQRRTWREVWE